mgnify:CR=1 FL=1
MTNSIMLEPYYDRNRYTVLKINDVETSKETRYIPLDVVEGLKIVSMSRTKFNDTYKPIPGYPIDKAIRLFMGYAKTLGASKEVLKLFSKFGMTIRGIPDNTEHSHKEPEQNKPESTIKSKPTKKLDAVKEPIKSKPIKKLDAVKEPIKSKPIKKLDRLGSSKDIMGEFKSAAAMFQGLIMEAKLTDAEIFEAVKEKFGVGDDKKGYVKWYRYNLTRNGKNPPSEVVR